MPNYTIDEIRAMNNLEVMYNGNLIDLYSATQKQRYIERQIRKWKREASAMEAAGQDATFSLSKIRDWQQIQRDFIKQTGLRRDYSREHII